MKKYLLIIAMTLFGTTVQAHEWEADVWGQKQINLTTDIMVCAMYISISYGEFIKHCSMKDISARTLTSSKELIDATDYHPDDTKLREFIDLHFKDITLGNRSVSSTFIMEDALKFINYRLKLLTPTVPNTEPMGLKPNEHSA